MSPLPATVVKWDQVLDAIHTWYKTETGLTVAWTKQPRMPQLAKPYGTLSVLSGPFKVGSDRIRKHWDPDEGDGGMIRRWVEGEREFVVQCKVYCDDVAHASHARIYADAAQTSLSKPSVIKTLAEADLAIINVMQVVDVSAIAGIDYEQVCSFDVRFRTSISVEDEAIINIERAILRIELHGTVKGPPIVIPEE
jgi:hypothetical protein